MTLGIDKRGVMPTLGTQSLHIHLGNLYLRLEGETVALHQLFAILEYHRSTAIDHILRRLAKATAGIDIGADGTCTLLCHQ